MLSLSHLIKCDYSVPFCFLYTSQADKCIKPPTPKYELVITTIRLGVYRNSLSSDSDSGTE